MEPITGQVHIGWFSGTVEMSQHVPNTPYLVGPNPARVSEFEEPFKATMSKRPDHFTPYAVSVHVSEWRTPTSSWPMAS
jgi:hypothetical protein